MTSSSLTHRERVLLALDHRETDRVPIAMVCSGFNEPARRALEAYLAEHHRTSVEAYLRPLLDIAQVWPEYAGPALHTAEDMWGVRREPISYGAGSYNEIAFYPLGQAAGMDDLAGHRWPSTEWFDYSVLPERMAGLRREGDHCLMVANGNIFETSWYMRGFERMLMDFVLNPELAHEILRRVCDFYVAHFRRVLAVAEGGIDLVFTADDIGGQEGLLMSLEMWSEFLQPYHSRLNQAIHEFGVRVIYHSDGAVMDAVPGLMEMGIDVLQALQFDAKGMDPGVLKREYGDRLCFQGGISVQSTLPFGTAEEVRAEVEARIDVLGRGGGYILGPSHMIQAGTPPENVVAMFDTAASHRLPSRRG